MIARTERCSGFPWFPHHVAVAAIACVILAPGSAPRVAQSADLPGSRNLAELRPFTRSALLARFDRNRDGKLDSKERSVLRRAFGGIDVPMLPTKSYDYSKVKRPAYFKAGDLREIDNTPADNPITDAGATLGRVLFYDRRLSRNNTIACASCHVQKAGFTDPRRFSIGFGGGRTGRNSMGLANVRYTNLKGERPGFFWDERAATLEEQVLMPIQDKVEMGMKLTALETKLRKLPYYPQLFASAFGSKKVTSRRIAKAVAQFLRSMPSFNSKFDRGAAGRNDGSFSANFANFTAQENLGKSLFIDGVGGIAEKGCAICHVPPTFNMQKSFNNGLDANSADRGLGALGRKPNDPFTPSDDGKFKASSLRNIALSAPYMHDGRFKTLEQVVEHYSSRVHPHKNLGLAFEPDKTGKPTSGFRYDQKAKAALVAFLKTLTDESFVSDPRYSDPFVWTGRPRALKPRNERSQRGRVVGFKPRRHGDTETRRSVSPRKPEGERSEPKTQTDTLASHGTPAEQYKSLIKEYEDEGRSRALARKFLKLAADHPKDPVAVDALIWVAGHVRTGHELAQALESLAKNHAKNPKLAGLCRRLVRKPSTAAEKLLRRLLKISPHNSVRAEACFHLAAYLMRQITQIETLKAEPDQAKRLDQFYGKGFSKRLLSLNVAKLSKEIEGLYELTIKSYAGVKVGESTMGAVAKKTLFAMRHLSVGKTAPEITGEDIDGKPFKLSDYRGKIVLLDFWGNW